MRWASMPWPLLAALSQGCSNAETPAPVDDRSTVPEGLAVTALPGGNGVLELTALSLREGPVGLELYAALRNVGDKPACHAALAVELFDKAEQSLAAGIVGLLSQRFYRLAQDADTIASCVAPGEVTMAALLELSSEVALEDVAHVTYRCPYFALDVRPSAGLEVSPLQRVARGGAAVYVGTLQNNLNAAIEAPSVSVFPTTRAGRPLGMVSASAVVTLEPGDSWAFETSAFETQAVDQLAFPAAAVRSGSYDKR